MAQKDVSIYANRYRRTLCACRVDHEPRNNVLECAVNAVINHGTARAELALHQLFDFGDNEYMDPLPSTDATHAECALNIISEYHVLAESDDCSGINNVLDVHARGVNLVVEREAPLERHTALVSIDNTARRAYKNLFASYAAIVCREADCGGVLDGVLHGILAGLWRVVA